MATPMGIHQAKVSLQRRTLACLKEKAEGFFFLKKDFIKNLTPR